MKEVCECVLAFTMGDSLVIVLLQKGRTHRKHLIVICLKRKISMLQIFVFRSLQACHDVVQKVEFVSREEKKTRLFQFIEEMGENDKAIIFVGRKLDVDDLTSDMAIKGYAAEAIHGGREQSDREGALVDFREGSTRLLVATDLASRGLDIVDITHVINFDFPRNIEEYVHRVGRTGRAGWVSSLVTCCLVFEVSSCSVTSRVLDWTRFFCFVRKNWSSCLKRATSKRHRYATIMRRKFWCQASRCLVTSR